MQTIVGDRLPIIQVCAFAIALVVLQACTADLGGASSYCLLHEISQTSLQYSLNSAHFGSPVPGFMCTSPACTCRPSLPHSMYRSATGIACGACAMLSVYKIAVVQGGSFAYLTPTAAITMAIKSSRQWNDAPDGTNHERFLVTARPSRPVRLDFPSHAVGHAM